PASIFATRDWLDRTALATASWVMCRRRLRLFRLSARRNFSSTYADSWSDSSRNSLAVPIFQPLASRRRFLASRIPILLEPAFAGSNHRLRGCPRLLGEYFQD